MAPRMFAIAALLVALLSLPASAQDPASAQEIARGRQLYALCEQCHLSDGRGIPLALAPSIAGLPQWYLVAQLQKFRAGYRGQHFDDIAGMRMRPMSRALANDADVNAVAAYIATFAPLDPPPLLEGGDAARGQALYAPCAACHTPDGSGNAAVNAPPLKHASDWYMLTQLVNFKAGVRGAKPGDTSGATMRPMSMTLADEQAMRDVIAYIKTFSKK